jgi:hypothetical protein
MAEYNMTVALLYKADITVNIADKTVIKRTCGLTIYRRAAKLELRYLDLDCVSPGLTAKNTVVLEK